MTRTTTLLAFMKFKNKYKFALTSFQDNNAEIFEKDLIPATPVKIYFNHSGTITSIDHMGTEGNLPSFLKNIHY